MSNIESLKPFKKGVDARRNLKGRPAKIPGLDNILVEILGEEINDMEAMKVILLSIRAKAMKGDLKCAELLLDRAYGKTKPAGEPEIEVRARIVVIGGDED